MITGMTLSNVLDEEELTTRVFVDKDILNLETDDEGVFFDAACKYIVNRFDFDVSHAKLYEVFTRY